jgi:hypothetical protein
MAILKKLLGALFGLAVLFVLIGLALPKTTHVEREIAIVRPPEEGPASGVGASMRWVSQKSDVGSGRQTIVEREPMKRIVVKLEFDGQADAYATYTLTPEGRGTRVVWSFDTDHKMNPLSRWFGLLFDKFIGPDYEQGLAKLKTVMETSNR